jgi:hypothetical protein
MKTTSGKPIWTHTLQECVQGAVVGGEDPAPDDAGDGDGQDLGEVEAGAQDGGDLRTEVLADEVEEGGGQHEPEDRGYGGHRDDHEEAVPEGRPELGVVHQLTVVGEPRPLRGADALPVGEAHTGVHQERDDDHREEGEDAGEKEEGVGGVRAARARRPAVVPVVPADHPAAPFDGDRHVFGAPLSYAVCSALR